MDARYGLHLTANLPGPLIGMGGRSEPLGNAGSVRQAPFRQRLPIATDR
jgi:hypothetical protein